MASLLDKSNSIVYIYGVNKTMIEYGEIYRLLTGTFVHVDLFHFLCNAYALYMIGNMVEGYYGKGKFIAIYLVSALTGSLLSIAMFNGFSIGASGAIFGLLGSLLYFGYHYRVYFGNVILGKIIPVIILNLAIGFSISNIDNFAHIGGLVGGFLIGIILTIIYIAFLIILNFVVR